MTDTKKKLALGLFDIGAIKLEAKPGGFTLKLHETQPDAPLSPIYLNLRTPENPKPGKLTPEIVKKCGALLYELARADGLEYYCVTGIPRAGEPFADAFVIEEQSQVGENVSLVLKMDKEESGDKRRIGELVVGETDISGKMVLPIDDLCTRAGSKFEAISSIETTGAVVKDILVLVDRQQGGGEELAARGYTLHAVFTLEELLSLYVQEGRINQATSDEVLAYVRENS